MALQEGSPAHPSSGPHNPDCPEGQPALFTGGVMRSYQVEGYQWLKVLYENGVNGILADEMGLGKTVQVIALIASLVESGLPGPYLVVAPLSTLPNWLNELQRFTPSLSIATARFGAQVHTQRVDSCESCSGGPRLRRTNVVTFAVRGTAICGRSLFGDSSGEFIGGELLRCDEVLTRQGKVQIIQPAWDKACIVRGLPQLPQACHCRGTIRCNSINTPQKLRRTAVVVTSYEVAMRDRARLAPVDWLLLVVDEAHRLKNFRCRLVRELSQYHASNRLLLTGTPLQNSLTELWALLHFLIPEIFHDLQAVGEALKGYLGWNQHAASAQIVEGNVRGWQFVIVSLRGGFVRFEGADEDEEAVGAIAVNGEFARRKAQHETARNSVDAEGRET
ncbi:hypothetical protein HPB52_021362 [Rhipicephalus sanguineus]|uniref:Helicase ATP-binding domain-containing protein n=1 Tax=Rhipicephalus sanguineus TaxID=34632 RepID=A0A9D4SRJ8_RHISA|nr:hypothetical protein HPB52_021362 [Rhipicephalus sanguineus]